MGGMQFDSTNEGLIFVQNDAQELCLFSIFEGIKIKKIFHVDDYKLNLNQQLGSLFTKQLRQVNNQNQKKKSKF